MCSRQTWALTGQRTEKVTVSSLEVSRRGVGAPYSPSRVPLSGGRFRGNRARFRGDREGAAPGTGGGATWDPSSGARVDQGPPTRPTRVGGVEVEEVPLLRGPGGPGSPYSRPIRAGRVRLEYGKRDPLPTQTPD